MKKLDLEKFADVKIANSKLVLGGGRDTQVGDSFWGYGTSVCDWAPDDAKADWIYYFEDGRQLDGDPAKHQ